jgi:sugar/nucleoside kinase (ribokinase family)
MAIQELSAAGVDVSGLVVDPSLKTGVTVVLSTGAERAFATYLGSISEVRRSDVKSELLAWADHLHVGSYYLQRAMRPDMLDLFQEAKRRGLTISTDPGWDSSKRWEKDLLAALRYVDIFLPNEVEAMTIAETDSPEKALEILAGYADTVVIKMGSTGCLARNSTASLYCPAFRVPVVDVTSAGDIFNAGFLHGFLNNWNLAETVQFANACGALAVSGAGSAGIMSGVAEVEAFLAARGSPEVTHRSPERGKTSG